MQAYTTYLKDSHLIVDYLQISAILYAMPAHGMQKCSEINKNRQCYRVKFTPALCTRWLSNYRLAERCELAYH